MHDSQLAFNLSCVQGSLLNRDVTGTVEKLFPSMANRLTGRQMKPCPVTFSGMCKGYLQYRRDTERRAIPRLLCGYCEGLDALSTKRALSRDKPVLEYQ